MIGAAFPMVNVVAGVSGPPLTSFPNGYLHVFRRCIGGTIHGLSGASSAWIVYKNTNNALKSVAEGGLVVNGDYLDMRFQNGFGLKLPHEIESYDPATGSVVARIKLTFFSLNQNYQLLHFFGKDGLTEEESDPIACWEGFFASINMATGLDASGNDRNFTLTGVGATTLLGAAAGSF